MKKKIVSAMRGVRIYRDALPAHFFSQLAEFLRAPSKEQLDGRTYWFPLGIAPRMLIEEAIHQLRPVARPGSRCVGAEWWVRREPPWSGQVLHFDKDELLLKRDGRVLHPLFASVLYLNDLGGGTLIADQTLSSDGKLLPPEAEKAVSISPNPNQYAVFPGNRLHGVIAGRKHMTALPKARITLLINWWTQRPLGVEDYDVKVGL